MKKVTILDQSNKINMRQKIKDFLNKLLFGMALAVVITLAPYAILGSILKPYAQFSSVRTFLDALVMLQGLLSLLTGILVALRFNFNPIQTSIIGAVAFISSGVIKHSDAGFMLMGIGDLLNVLIFTSVAVLVTQWLGQKLGSLTIIFQPIIVGAFLGFLGLLALPYVSAITLGIGNLILYFTQLQPLLMSMLIAISFAVLIISPISTVAISLIIGLTGLASGAANLGVTSTTAVLIVGSLFARNKSGITLAILLGAMKMMIPNLFKSPIMYMAIILNAICCGLATYFFHITGTAKSGGFGIVGMIGPIETYQQLINTGNTHPILTLSMVYLFIPFGCAILLHLALSKFTYRYSSRIYHFND